MTQHRVRAVAAIVGVVLAAAPLASAFAEQHPGAFSHARYSGHGSHHWRGFGWPVVGLAAAAAAIVTAPFAIASSIVSAPYYSQPYAYGPASGYGAPRYYEAPPAGPQYYAPPQGYYEPQPQPQREYQYQYAPQPQGYYDPRANEAPGQYRYAPQPQGRYEYAPQPQGRYEYAPQPQARYEYAPQPQGRYEYAPQPQGYYDPRDDSPRAYPYAR